jgi:hypothetical protein
MVDKQQDSENKPPADDFPPLEAKFDESSADRTEAPKSPFAEQSEKIIEPGKPTVKKDAKPQKQAPSFWMRTLRWVLGILIVFGLGVIIVVYLGLVPAQNRTFEINQELQSAQQRISEIQSQAEQEQARSQAEIERLNAFESANEELQAQLSRSELRVAILSAQNDIVNAQLALEKEDINSASLALSQTSETLDTISGLLAPNQREVITVMKDRLDLAIRGLDTDTFAARSDLDVLYNDLIKLENTFFSQP